MMRRTRIVCDTKLLGVGLKHIQSYHPLWPCGLVNRKQLRKALTRNPLSMWWVGLLYAAQHLDCICFGILHMHTVPGRSFSGDKHKGALLPLKLHLLTLRQESPVLRLSAVLLRRDISGSQLLSFKGAVLGFCSAEYGLPGRC